MSYVLLNGDCLERLKEIPDNSIDSVVTDPPYGLSQEPDIAEVMRHWLAGDRYEGKGGGFMGKTWDSFVPGPEYWREVYRVLKPGGHLLAFSGARTYGLMEIAIRFARFEVRDMIDWLYGTGFPKSLNIGEGRGTALKPAHEPIVMARKPLDGTVAANVQKWGTGAINVDGCRIESGARPLREHVAQREAVQGSAYAPTTSALAVGDTTQGRWPANVILDEEAAAELDKQSGVLKSGSRKASAPTLGYHGGAKGQNPACESSEGGASRFFYVAKASRKEREAGCEGLPLRTAGEATDREDGSAGLNSPRAGAGRTSGARNRHPTVKPIALMRHLVRLVTPPGGIVLDPFTGSGSTGIAAKLEGFSFIGIERECEYIEIAEARIKAA